MGIKPRDPLRAYYNEIDPYAAQWLRNLIDAGAIAPGVVDERSIEDVRPSDIAGFTQCHWFAGIGVWSYALRQAGWADDRPVWTGSCPCQPFSAAGKGAGFADERHLWPAWHHLIRECNPATVFGEQVASKDAMPWIDLVHTDMEALGYAFGAVPIASAGVGAPHIRERLYWVGNSIGQRLERFDTGSMGGQFTHTERASSLSADWLANAERWPTERHRHQVAGAESSMQGAAWEQRIWHDAGDGIKFDWLVQPDSNRRESWRTSASTSRFRHTAYATSVGTGIPGPTNGHWRDADWLLCRDGKWRPVEPGTSPLAPRTPNHVGRLRAYGNAITAQVAQAFIEAAM